MMILGDRYIGDRLVGDEEFSKIVISNPKILHVIYQAKERIEREIEQKISTNNVKQVSK